MSQQNLEKVLGKLATTDKSTLVVSKEADGEMRVTSGSWGDEKVFLPDQELEVRKVEDRSVRRLG